MNIILTILEVWVTMSIATVVAFNIAKYAVGRWTTS